MTEDIKTVKIVKETTTIDDKYTITKTAHKRKLETSDLVSKKLSIDERTLSISSTDSEIDLSEKLDRRDISSNSSSDNEEELKQKEEQNGPDLKKQRISRAKSEVNLTEQHLIEADDDTLQTALVIKSFEEPFTVDESYPIPDINEHEILVENKFIGLNPIDWKGKKYRFGVYSFPWIQGRESSGIVKKLGSKVTNFKEGDEVFIASTSYRDLRTSTFQQFTVFDSRLVWKLPKNLSLKEGSAIGVGLVTAGSVLEELNVNIFNNDDYDKETYLKPEDRKSILVWGASSGVGSYVVQLAKVAGFEKIIAIASSKHDEFLNKIGATHVIDRFKSIEEISEELSNILEDGLQIGVDVVGKETSNNVINLLNLKRTDEKESKIFVGVVSKPSKDLDSKLLENIQLKEVLIKKFHENIKHGENLVKTTHDLLENGKILSQKNLKVYKGFNGITKGLEDLEEFGASNEKYIVEL